MDDQKIRELVAARWLKGFNTEELVQLYKEGYLEAMRDWKKCVRDLKEDIEHSGFDKECVLLTLEDWLA